MVDFLEHIGGKVLYSKDGKSELYFNIEPHHHQHLGMVHGGAIAALADHAGWYAVVSEIGESDTSTTIELKINYLKPVLGDRLTAKAIVINKTKKTAFATIELFSNNILVAYATGTYIIFEEKK